MAELLHGALTHEIIGAYYEVYNALPWGLPESAYGHAMSLVLSARGLVYRREVPFNVQFRGHVVCTMRADLIVERAVLVGIKAGDRLAAAHEAAGNLLSRAPDQRFGTAGIPGDEIAQQAHQQRGAQPPPEAAPMPLPAAFAAPAVHGQDPAIIGLAATHRRRG